MALMKRQIKDEGFSYNPDETKATKDATIELTSKNEEPLFKWSSPNGFSSSKSFGWYSVLVLITVVLSGLIYLATKDKITTAVILVSGLLIGVYAAKKPRQTSYQLTAHSFTINGRGYNFSNYRSFSVVHHSEASSIVFTPLKRFIPYVYIYFSGDMTEQIEATLAGVLPNETSRQDLLENLLRKIGF